MSWPNVLALAVFVCVCGFIAYAGDLLGRKMGKKRLSLFGMRPRYTAIVTTTITGMLIASFTIGVVSIANKEVGSLILRGADILRTQEQEIARQKTDAQQARSEAQEAELQRDSLHKEVGTLISQISKLESDVQKNEADLRKAQKQLADAEREIVGLNREIAERQEEIAEQKNEIRRVTGELEEVHTALNVSHSELQQAHKQLADAEVELANAEIKLTDAEARLLDAQREVNEREREILAQRTEIASLEERRAGMLEELAHLFTTSLGYVALREQDIIFRSTEELARRAIRCSQPKSDIRRDVMELIEEADVRARLEGAAVGDNGRAIAILPKRVVDPFPLRPGDDDGRFLPESESIDALVDNIWLGSGSVVVLVISLGNSVRGEQVLVDLSSYHNQLIYSEGEEVASIVIDGSKSHGAIFSQLTLFLRSNVRNAAMERHIIPVYDKDGLSVGQLANVDDWDDMLDMVLHIKEVDGRVRVTARAEHDIYSVGPLAVGFDVGDPQ